MRHILYHYQRLPNDLTKTYSLYTLINRPHVSDIAKDRR